MEKSKEAKEQQLDMGFKEPFSNKIKKDKYKIDLFFVRLRTNSLLKNPAIWILSFLTISFLLIQKHYYDNYFNQLPKDIPLFKIKESLEFRLVDSNYLLPILLISILLTIVSLILTLRTYYKFKILSIMILGNLFLSIFLITVAYIRIFGIYIF